MFKKLTTSLLVFIAFVFIAKAQITVDPAFPNADELVTVILDATGTGLEDYTGTVYAHTGLTVNGDDWQYVIGDWGNNTNQPVLEKIGANSYKLEITPSIRSFYNVDGSANITEMSFVFRGEDGSPQTSPDIFYNVYSNSLAVAITQPIKKPLIVQMDDIIHVEWSTFLADSSLLYIGDKMVFADTGSSFSYDFVISDFEKQWVTAVAKNGTDSVSDSFYYYVRGDVVEEELPEGIRDGITYTSETSAILCLYAPEKEYVFAWGDYSNWELSDEVYMKRTPDQNRYWVEITGLEPKKQYVFQYYIDNDIPVGDMYCEQISDPNHDQYISEATYPNLPEYPVGKTEFHASVLQTAQDKYEWQTVDYAPPKNTDLVIYELLIRDFVEAHDYNTLIDTLDYLERIGINAIELMPVNEFGGNISWGYNPNYYFAPDKYYGPRNTLKAFIDECHSREISVFIDLVLNHANLDCPFVAMYYDWENGHPTANNPWFNEEGNFPYSEANTWGSDFNHESPQTQMLVDSINSYWMSEYKIDGFRFDFTKGFSNTIHGEDDEWGSKYDADRIAILKRMSDEIWKRNEDAVVIFEHLSENSEEKALADYGIMLWGKMTTEYNEGTMGYNENQKSDLYWGYYGHRNWNDPNLVTYMESHDEERLMFKNVTYGNSNGDYNIKDTTIALQRQALAANFFYTIPGPKMLWQFGERGYDISIDFNGRTGEKPPRWDYMEQTRRRNLYYINKALIKLKVEEDVFETNDFTGDGRYAKKWYWLKSDEMDVFVLGNFDVKANTFASDINPIGTWYEFWTGDTLVVTNDTELTLEAGEYRLYTSKKLDAPDYVGINKNKISSSIDEALVFPNPATSQINLMVSMNENEHADISLYDLQGKNVQTLYAGKLSKGINDLDAGIENITEGLYFIVIRTDYHQLVKKLMVQ